MMAKRTLWQWLFCLMAKPEQDRQPMATPNNRAPKKPMAGTVSLTEDELTKLADAHIQRDHDRVRRALGIDEQQGSSDVELRDMAHRLAGGEPQRDIPAKWEPGCEHKLPHPVKENPDGTLYYKGKVYRMIGDHGRRSNNKRRQG